MIDDANTRYGDTDPRRAPHEPHVDPRLAGSARARPASATGIVSDILNHVTNLFRKEVDLVRTEMSSNLQRAGIAVGLLVGAVVLALVALNVLAAALVAAIAELGLEAGWAALIVGGVLALIAFFMVMKGVNDLKAESLAPTRSVKNVQRDAEAVKEAL